VIPTISESETNATPSELEAKVVNDTDSQPSTVAQKELSFKKAQVAEALKYLKLVARGEVPFDDSVPSRVRLEAGAYTYNSLVYLESIMRMSRKEILALAMSHYLRSITSRQLTAQNDIGVILQGLQFSVQDLALEVQAFSELTMRTVDFEATRADPGQPL
jgi:hypothetical protein